MTETSERFRPENPVELMRIVVPTAALVIAPPLVLEKAEAVRSSDRPKDDGVGGDNPRNRSNTARVNHHPTVKPIALMQYLVRMVTPPGGVILDPFMGSGSTGCAAVREGFNFIGIDIIPEYVSLSEKRIAHHAALQKSKGK